MVTSCLYMLGSQVYIMYQRAAAVEDSQQDRHQVSVSQSSIDKQLSLREKYHKGMSEFVLLASTVTMHSHSPSKVDNTVRDVAGSVEEHSKEFASY